MEYVAIIENNRILLKSDGESWNLPEAVEEKEGRVSFIFPSGRLSVKKTGRLETLFKEHVIHISKDVNHAEPPKKFNEEIRFFHYEEIVAPTFIIDISSRNAIDKIYMCGYLKLR